MYQLSKDGSMRRGPGHRTTNIAAPLVADKRGGFTREQALPFACLGAAPPLNAVHIGVHSCISASQLLGAHGVRDHAVPLQVKEEAGIRVHAGSTAAAALPPATCHCL
jgi:hypothetical protein